MESILFVINPSFFLSAIVFFHHLLLHFLVQCFCSFFFFPVAFSRGAGVQGVQGGEGFGEEGKGEKGKEKVGKAGCADV